MRQSRRAGLIAPAAVLGFAVLWTIPACQSGPAGIRPEWAVADALENYRSVRVEELDAAAAAGGPRTSAGAHAADGGASENGNAAGPVPDGAPFFLCTFGFEQEGAEAQPAAGEESQSELRPALPEGYWRENVWHQMGYEARDLATRGVWQGFKTSYWDLENALILTAAMGASISIRETGVDDAIRRRTEGDLQLGDLDETIQILGNPGTHFAAAGALWLGSALLQNAREHEVARTLGEALAVNGLSTIVLKVAANTTAPNGDEYAWPSGHTSSAFTVAAVLNEYYGPWVGVPSIALAGLVGYQRIDSRVHDFSDVVFGAVLGYVIGASIADEHKGELPELFGMTVLPFADPQTGSTGIALYKQWK